MSDIEIKNIVANFISAKKNLKKLAPDFNWGSLLGDYGELVAIKHYGWEKAPTGKKGYDAINKQKKTIQIKTVYSTNQIKFKKGTKADYLLVIEVDDNANWESIYYGNFEKIRVAASLTKNDEYTIGVTTLKKISNNTFSPREEVSLTLKTGRVITASTREDLHKILTKKGHNLPPIGRINRRINDFNWDLDRAFQIKAPPNYLKVEHLIENDGYKWFPERPTLDKNRIPLVSHFEKRIYIAQNYFCEDKGIPTWYVSEKLKLGWDSSRIILGYQERKKIK
ncbi:hypothetical protein N8Z69_03045 [Candidatus Thioglobus sp.]|nr:hypothetical protein [Candidatus Thioglobus sp.]MDC1290358.1 hypothetical protein [Candidatus Thioglobus sp.]